MKVVNFGRGIHQREMPGLERLKSLPDDWSALTNLDLVLPQGPREIDIVMYIPDRILLIDLKDWRGKVESADGAWFLNGRERGRSPVAKISENARQVSILLGKHLDDLARRTRRPKLPTPRIDGLVVLTGTSDVSGIAPTEIGSVFALDDFIRTIANTKDRINRLPKAAPCFVETPLTSDAWKPRLDKFFNASTGFFRPGTRRYGGYIAPSDAASFAHATGLYAEYDVEDGTAARATGLLRKWDFTRAETRFQTEQGRNEIVGRERNVIAWLNDQSPDCEAAVLQPRVDEPERGVSYWEVFDKRRRLKRLSELVKTELARHSSDAREELVRQMLARATTLHNYDAAHLDLGLHSVWIESPSSYVSHT